jgi:hypothetical protein
MLQATECLSLILGTYLLQRGHMSKIEYRAPQNYIYLDREGIDSLYAQTTARLETQFVTEKERNREGKVGFGAALKVLVFGDARADAELSLSGRNLEQVTSTLSVEQKLAGLIRYLNRFENEKYFDNIHQAAFQCSQRKMSVFINIETEFDLPQFYWGREYGVNAVNLEKTISFEISPSPQRPKSATGIMLKIGGVPTSYEEPYDSSDNYFKRGPLMSTTNKPRILMNASLNKCTRIPPDGTMRPTGHDAQFFSGHEGRDVRLGVFGSLNTLGSAKYQIKPYAIWI